MPDRVGRSSLVPELRDWAAGVDIMIMERPGSSLPGAERVPRVQVHPPEVGTSVVWVWQPGTDGRTVVLPPRGQAEYAAGKAALRAVRLRLRPGVGVLLGEPPSDEPSHTAAAGGLVDAAAALQSRVAERLARRSFRDLTRARTAVQAIAALESAGPRRQSIADVADRLALSRRQLHRIVVQQTGIGPKQVARIGRVRRVLAAVGRGRVDWGDQALQAGYYDQSHLISDFTAIMKVTPQAYLERRLPTPTSC
ncbi:helix-turn-helix domain-containing protein [Microlunatus soli]|uniref:AraC-type DNA-binding protein n=1 Tax=Microlunatus soli TaxID=630515 RepID=A0A1H1NTW1_9ACTN|nr:AraC family transcriptional regulator [Microlunatus soli]SDS02383.1 AraC-type DNA-binding protein [Microlunatus soli]